MAEVISIHLAAEIAAPVYAVESVEAVAGAGLRGDRKFQPGAPPEKHLTLIESEELEQLAAEHGDRARRRASRAVSSRRAACA